MTTLADDLRAARGLIDTPEKLEMLDGRVSTAIRAALRGAHGRNFSHRFEDIREALDRARSAHTSLEEWESHPTTSHAAVLSTLDRAIAAAESKEPA